LKISRARRRPALQRQPATGQGGIVALLRLDAAPSWDGATLVAELARLDRIIAAARPANRPSRRTSIKDAREGHARQ